MQKLQILVVGCSFTANCGFNDQNRLKYHWPVLLSNHYSAEVVNVGIGGSSNDEIFQRTIQLITKNVFDIVVVMWSSLGRKWVYYSDQNIDDFTSINGPDNIVGLRPKSAEIQQYAKLHYAYFNNQYIDLKFWLGQIIALHGLLDFLNIKHVFIKGFDNWVDDFNKVKHNSQGFVNISSKLKNILNFDNNPEDRINQKIQEIKNLFPDNNLINWVNFNGPSFNSLAIDAADDGSHPGPESNYKLFRLLVDHIDQQELIK